MISDSVSIHAHMPAYRNDSLQCEVQLGIYLQSHEFNTCSSGSNQLQIDKTTAQTAQQDTQGFDKIWVRVCDSRQRQILALHTGTATKH